MELGVRERGRGHLDVQDYSSGNGDEAKYLISLLDNDNGDREIRPKPDNQINENHKSDY